MKMFFVPGGGCMHLVDSLAQCKQLKGINLLHEQGATIAAESYAFTAGKVGAALLTTGPGGTNGITGVLSAYLDSIPCIILSGQVKTADLKDRFGVRSHGSQEADIISMVKGMTKYAVMITEANSIRYHLEKAWHLATTGRKGPVWIDIPLDIQGSSIDPAQLVGYTAPQRVRADLKDEVMQLLALIKQAKRPILIAGNGLRGAEELFDQVLKHVEIPVIPTWKAVDLMDHQHPLYAGKCGTLGDRAANFAMQTSDLLISLGSKLDFSITGFDRTKWATKAKKVVVDIDETELYKLQMELELPIVVDVKELLTALLELLQTESIEKLQFPDWLQQINKWQETYRICTPLNARGERNEQKISTYELVAEICKQVDENTVIVPSSAGTVAEICYQAMNVKKGWKVRSNHGLGAMGYELPAAIGAHFAEGAKVVTIAGDGGIQLNIQELAIIAGRKLPIKVFVINNGGYASIRNMQRNHFQGRYAGSNEETGLLLPDMATLARAYGMDSYSVSRPTDLHEMVKKTLTAAGPCLCDVQVDPFCIVSPRSTSKVLPDGNIVSTALEDLFPFLTEDQLKKELEQGLSIGKR